MDILGNHYTVLLSQELKKGIVNILNSGRHVLKDVALSEKAKSKSKSQRPNNPNKPYFTQNNGYVNASLVKM